MEHIKEIILNYANTDTSNHYALMIDGEWGSGKTYYFKESIKEEIEKATGKKFIYVSLNGIKSGNEIFEELIAARYQLFDFIQKNKFGKVAFGALRSLTKLGVNAVKIISGVGGSTQIEGEPDANDLTPVPLKELISFSKEEHILCFDDLERASRSFEVADILGFINSNFVEHEGIKVLIICHEKEIVTKGKEKSESDISKEKQYQRIKEKIIGRTIRFDPELEEVFRSIFHSYSKKEQHQKLNQFISRHYSYVLKKIVESKQQNLRAILFLLDNLSTILNKIEDDHTVELLGKEIFLSVLVFSFEYKDGHLAQFSNKDDLPPVFKNDSNTIYTYFDLDDLFMQPKKVEPEKEENAQKKQEEIIEYEKQVRTKYFGGNNYQFIPAIFQFIQTGYLPSQDLKEQLSALLPKEQPPHIDALKKLERSLFLGDEEFKEVLKIIFSSIEKGMFSFPEFVKIANLLHLHSRDGILPNFSKESLNEFLLQYLGKALTTASFEQLNDIGKALQRRSIQFEESLDLKKAISEIVHKFNLEQKEIKIDEDYKMLLSDEEYVRLDPREFQDVLTYHSEEAILDLCETGITKKRYIIDRFIDHLKEAYLTGEGKIRVLPREAERLNLLWKWSKQFLPEIDKNEQPISTRWAKSLTSELEAICDNMEIGDERISHIKWI